MIIGALVRCVMARKRGLEDREREKEKNCLPVFDGMESEKLYIYIYTA